MKKILFLSIIFLSILFLSSAHAIDWRQTKGDHFIVQYTPPNKDFAKDVLFNAEGYYKDIAKELGYQRYSDFWLWDKRVKIYIYPDHKSYLKGSKMPDWSHGMADYVNKTIKSYARGEGFVDSILPHEIAHLLFRDFVGFESQIPLWLDEGVAQWSEVKKRPHFKRLMQEAINNKRVLSLADMMKLNLSVIKSDDEVHIRYSSLKEEPIILILSGENLINLYYLESVSLVAFLVEKYGSKKFTVFCRELKNGKSVDDALRVAYPYAVKNVSDLEIKWWEYSMN